MRDSRIIAIGCGMLIAATAIGQPPVTTAPICDPTDIPAPQSATSRSGHRMAPSFWIPTISGKSIDFPGTYKGKLVLVTFWATWCPVCKGELKFWREAYARYHERGLEVLGFATDLNKQRSLELVKDELKVLQIPWEQVYDSAPDIQTRFGSEMVPMCFLVDGDTGEIIVERRPLRRESLNITLEAELAAKQARMKLASATSAGQPATTKPASGSTNQIPSHP